MAKLYVVANACFLPSEIRGMWVKTNRCVAFVACPDCKAPIGEMCRGDRGPVRYTHTERRKLYTATKKLVDKARRVTVVMELEKE